MIITLDSEECFLPQCKNMYKLPYGDLSLEELVEVYLYTACTFGRNNQKTRMVMDEIRCRESLMSDADENYDEGYENGYENGYNTALQDNGL